jgi:hypothetical protein
MTETIARRTILRSALAVAASVIAGTAATSTASEGRSDHWGATQQPCPPTRDLNTLHKYAGEFGGSAKQPSKRSGFANGRL